MQALVEFIYQVSCYIFIASSLLMFLSYIWKAILFTYALFKGRKGNNFNEAKKEHRFLILIPARDESKVIKNLLDTIKSQNYSKDKYDVIIGVESFEDPTCEIAAKYSYNVYKKRHLEKKGKGYIIKEMIKYADDELKLKYDAITIFDADNLVHENYLMHMNRALDQGYDVAVGYRNTKNWNSSWVSACSGLTFLRFSTLENLARSKFNATVQLSGTGFYITKKELDRLGGWNFFTLTEDLEFTMIMALNKTKCTYVSKAIFYDEQPIKFKDSINQRTRWVKGYTQVSKKYTIKAIKGIFKKNTNKLGCYDFGLQALPFALFSISFISVLISILTANILSLLYRSDIRIIPFLYVGFLSLFVFVLSVYMFIVFDTMLVIWIDRKNIKMNKRTYIKTIFMNPIFISWYTIIATKTMFKKNVEWVRIEHTVDKSMDDINNEINDAI